VGKIILQDLDGQFTFYPEVLPQLPEILAVLKKQTGFDPNVGRKLFSFGKAAGFSFLNVETELYHKVFGKIGDFNYDLWHLKLDIACNYLKRILNNETGENENGHPRLIKRREYLQSFQICLQSTFH
jgi:hypothetical protein